MVGLTPHKTPPQLSKRPQSEEALGLTHPVPHREHLYRPVPCRDGMISKSDSAVCMITNRIIF